MSVEAETAIPANFNVGETNQEVASDVEIKEDTSGKELASLKNNKGWLEVEEYINARIDTLKAFDMDGMSVEAIGYKHALTDSLIKELQNIIDIIDANYEFEKQRKERGETK